MEENFDLLAQSRANYYTKGSPIQFVRVELLKGDVSGDIAVCLSFKNITNRPLVGLTVNFKCKDRTGEIVCEDRFDYLDLDTSNGQVFGSDDAVYISENPIGSVEVDLLHASFADGSSEDLTAYHRVRLQPAQKLPREIAKQLCERTHKDGLTVVPQVLDEGWYCACGAFHPRDEEGVWCSECGADRILLQNTLSGLLQKEETPAAPAADSEPTRMAAPVKADEPTRMAPPVKEDFGHRPAAPVQEPDDDSDMLIAPERPARHERPAAPSRQAPAHHAQERPAHHNAPQDAETARRDAIAEEIIRWAPPITAVLCAITAIIGFIAA